MNCEEYSSFKSVSSNHWIVTAKIRLILRRNAARKITTTHYDYCCLPIRILAVNMLTLRNKFDALQDISETLTPNDEYEKFVNAHIKVAAECIPTKQRAKYRVPWKILAVRKNVSTWKPHPYAIGGTQQILTLRNLKRHKIN